MSKKNVKKRGKITQRMIAEALANQRNFNISNLKGQPGYEDRKGDVLAIYNEHGELLAKYSTWKQVIEYLERRYPG